MADAKEFISQVPETLEDIGRKSAESKKLRICRRADVEDDSRRVTKVKVALSITDEAPVNTENVRVAAEVSIENANKEKLAS